MSGPEVRNIVEFVGGPRDGDREEWKGWLGEEIHIPAKPPPIDARLTLPGEESGPSFSVHVYRSAARADHRDVFGHGAVLWRFDYRGLK